MRTGFLGVYLPLLLSPGVIDVLYIWACGLLDLDHRNGDDTDDDNDNDNDSDDDDDGDDDDNKDTDDND